MGKSGDRMIKGAEEMVAVAKGEKPAAAMWHNGYRYVHVPDGWQLVPKRPTVPMFLAAQSAWLGDPLRKTSTLWDAMIASAPTLPSDPPAISEAPSRPDTE